VQVRAACGHVAELVDYLALAGCAPAWVPLGATALLLVAVLGYLLLLMATTADRYSTRWSCCNPIRSYRYTLSI
jgi:hypothetical protein